MIVGQGMEGLRWVFGCAFFLITACSGGKKSQDINSILGSEVFKSGEGVSLVFDPPGCDPIFEEDCEVIQEPPSDELPGDEPPGDEPPDDDPPNHEGCFEIPTRNICSDSGAIGVGTTLQETNNVAVVLYKVTQVYHPSVMHYYTYDIVHTITDPTSTAQIRADLINERKLYLDIASLNLPNGNYLPMLCAYDDQEICHLIFSVMREMGHNPPGRLAPIAGGFFLIRVQDGIPSVNLSHHSAIDTLDVVYAGNSPGTPESVGCDHFSSPLLIDVGGEGIALSAPLSGVDFDINGDGTKKRISWPLNPDSNAFLVLDRNGNGNIDDAHELFGNNTLGPDHETAANGFLALRKYDSDRNGIIDALDPIFSELRLWKDHNRNGVSERGELIPLRDAQIRAIHTRHLEIQEFDSYGNQTRQRSILDLENGNQRLIVDVWFRLI